MDRFHLVSVFVAVVDAQGFAGAARKLGMSPPAVTRAINDLESHLGLRLLTRTTRTVRVTEAGERYAQDCRRILAELKDADESVAGQHAAPRGRLAITAPALFGSMHVTPVVTEYLGRYPGVSAACLFLDRVVNLLEEGLDVAVRIGDLPDSTLQAVRVGHVQRVICAAPGYLARAGTPQTPADLQQHTVILAGGDLQHTEWKLQQGDTTHNVRLQARLATTTNDSAVAAAVGGFGITRLMSYQVAEHLRDGSLVALLPGYSGTTLPVHLLHREGRNAPQRVRAFLDLAIERLRANPALG